MSVTISVHSNKDTTISRGLPGGATPGGWITIRGDDGADVSLFPPRDVTDAADFWRYLSNVASDLAADCEAAERKGE